MEEGPAAAATPAPQTKGGARCPSDSRPARAAQDLYIIPIHQSWTWRGYRNLPGNIGTTMAEDIPVVPKACTLEVRTGNIVNWNRLKRKPNHTPTEEVADCVVSTVKKYLASRNKTELQYMTDLVCIDSEFRQPLLPEERGELKVIVKVFLCSQQTPAVVLEAVSKVMEDLGVSFVETVLLSLSMFESEEHITLELIQPFWQVLEQLVSDGRVLSLGISDLGMKSKLEELYAWAKVKPSIDQVNLASCCVMPKDLAEYAKQEDIQLQTHNDPMELMPAATMQETMRQCGTDLDGVGWEAQWVARYAVLVKCRGIIRSKGYVLRAVRDLHRRS